MMEEFLEMETAYSLGAFLIAICLKVITTLTLWLLLACDIILSFMYQC